MPPPGDRIYQILQTGGQTNEKRYRGRRRRRHLVCRVAVHHRLCPPGLVEDYPGHRRLAAISGMGVGVGVYSTSPPLSPSP